MIEAIIRNYLLTALQVSVYVDVPPDPPDSYVILERTNGGENEHIRSATIAIQSYGKTKLEAATLHEEVMEKMNSLITLDEISSCKINAEYDWTDMDTKQYRYQAVYNIVYYGG